MIQAAQLACALGLYFADYILCTTIVRVTRTTSTVLRMRSKDFFPKGGQVIPFINPSLRAANAWHARSAAMPTFKPGGVVNGPGNHPDDLCRLPCGFDPNDSTPHLHEGLIMRAYSTDDPPQTEGQRVARQKGEDLATILLQGNVQELRQFFAGIYAIGFASGATNRVDSDWALNYEEGGRSTTELGIRVFHGRQVARTPLEQKLEDDRQAALKLTQNPEPDEDDDDLDDGGYFCGCC